MFRNYEAGHYDVIKAYGDRACLWPDLLDYEEGAFEGFFETKWEQYMVEIGDRNTDEHLILFTFVGHKSIYRYWHNFTVLWWDPEIPDKGYDYRIPNWWYNRRGDIIWL